MLSIELEQALELLDALKKSTSEALPHFMITFALYRCRFEKKEIFTKLYCDFVDVGYNPLRKMSGLESLMLEHIVEYL